MCMLQVIGIPLAGKALTKLHPDSFSTSHFFFFSLHTTTFLTKMEKNDKRVWWSTTMHHFSGLGPHTRHVAVLVPPEKCVGPRGGVFFSADHPSLLPSSHTYFFSWPVLFGIGAQSKNMWDSIHFMHDYWDNNKDNGRDAAATFSCALFTAC